MDTFHSVETIHDKTIEKYLVCHGARDTTRDKQANNLDKHDTLIQHYQCQRSDIDESVYSTRKMNNNQFRKLVFDTPARQNDASPGPASGATPTAFGAKKSSFMPMTPRAVKGGVDVDFARQVRERNAALRPTKKFKSHAPRGVKYGAGYTDRAKAREEAAEEGDNKAARIQALEEQMKLGQIPLETFEALRDQIAGGDISSTHLVKGLDRKLLERVRQGEDVLGVGGGDGTAAEAPPDVDEELEKLGEKEVETVKREKAEKKGSMAPPPPVAGVKRSRNEIMAELKAQRQAAARVKAASMLDGRWRKVGEKEKSRIEIDSKGREVLITVDEDGVVKKKVRKVSASAAGEQDAQTATDMPDASKPVLGADTVIPSQAPQAVAMPEDEDDDIFEGVGTEYNPLGDDVDDDDDSDEETPKEIAKLSEPSGVVDKAAEDDQPDAELGEVNEQKPAVTTRNYFKDTAKDAEEATRDHFADIENVLKKAANLDASRSAIDGVEDVDDDREGESEEARAVRLKKRAAMLAQRDRDMDDMDMGFGSSRYEDEEEAGGEEKKIRLSEWKGAAGGGDEGVEEDGKGGGKRKRKPKKRKGDVNNAADIMRVIEGRKVGGAK